MCRRVRLPVSTTAGGTGCGSRAATRSGPAAHRATFGSRRWGPSADECGVVALRHRKGLSARRWHSEDSPAAYTALVKGDGSMRLRTLRSFLAAGALALACSAQGLPVQAAPPSGGPNLGPNVLVFDPSMKLADIQAAVNGVAAQQVNSESGTGRYALLFKPGTYGSSTSPLTFQVGYYTTVAGLGQSPDDVVINGSIDVFDRCLAPDGGNCIALVNFWRSLSNLQLNVVTPRGGCRFGEFWAVSQAAPMRRVHVNGLVTLMDYCLQPAFASGGFIADSEFDGSVVINGSQQQWITRNSKVDLWTNAVWNQVFSGVSGAPAQSFPNPTFTTLAKSPVTRES